MSAKNSAAGVGLGAPALPQVNLLPPEIHAARSLGRTKRWLGIGVLAVVGAIGVGYMWATFEDRNAKQELADAQRETEQLLTEQRSYSEVLGIIAERDRVLVARSLSTSTEVLWSPYLDAIAEVSPDSVSITSLSYTGATPDTAAAGPADPLQGPSIGTLTFEARAITMPDLADWLDALATVPGFADPWYTVAEHEAEDSEAKVLWTELGAIGVGDNLQELTFYTITFTVQVTEDALSGRFTTVEPEEVPAGDDAAADTSTDAAGGGTSTDAAGTTTGGGS